MLHASPKGTVPVLILPDGQVIEESWEIMQWALQGTEWTLQKAEVESWIALNDDQFKMQLDAYKYPEQFPELHPMARDAGGEFLQCLENVLNKQPYLLGNSLSIVDLAIFPFVRQFAHVDKEWWQSQTNFPSVREWLAAHLDSDYFKAVMKNRPVWEEGHQPLWVDEPALQTKNQFRAKACAN